MEAVMDKIIIFGSGQVGREALMFLGNEHVVCFCDNNMTLAGTEKYGKMVISFAELKENYSDAIIIIAVAGSSADTIAEQCEENGIPDYLNYRFLRRGFPEYNGTALFCFIQDPSNRMRVRKDMYYEWTKELKGQLAYFKSHADIRHMKPATGELRDRQEQCVRTSSLFIKKIEKLGVRPVLDSGNLLGYVRHGGFIPWDDDVDFTLIRTEYERLKEYCRQHIYTEDEWDHKKDVVEKEILPGFECYYWYLWHDHFSVAEVKADGYRVGMDFFPLEYYADHYSFSELRVFAAKMRSEVVCKETEEEKIACVKKALEINKENVAEESEHIYFGLDNMGMRNSYHRGEFIPKNVVFPLKQILWEGELFWVPNDAEEFLTYEYESPWSFPNDVGIPLHLNISQEEM